MKPENYNWVAKVKFDLYPAQSYYFALYDDSISVGDRVVVTGNSNGIPKVDEILPWTAEIAKEKIGIDISQEIICKADFSKYEKRKQILEEKQKLKIKMNKRKKKIQEMKDDDYYASVDEEYADLLSQYRSLSF